MTVDLTPSWIIGSIDLTSSPYSVDASGTVEIGEPEMVVETVASQIADGDIERVVRHGNRAYVLPIYIEGVTLGELATAEADLRAVLQSSGLTLTHDPGDRLSPTSVYEVFTARLTPARDDTFESHLIRKFTLTLTCAPFARSVEPVITEALLVSSGGDIVVDTCDSPTGWNGTINGVDMGPPDPNWLGQSGRLYVYDLGTPGPQLMTLTRTGSFSVSTTPYIRVNVHANEPLITYARAVIDGRSKSLTLISQRKAPTSSDEQEFIFAVPSGSTTVTSLTIFNYSYKDSAAFGVSEVGRSGAPSASIRQMARILPVGGTERTTGSIHVASRDGTSPLYTTLIATWPNDGSGYMPQLRRWRTSGNTVVASPNALSDKSEPLHPNAVICAVPNSALPNGQYQLAARVAASATGPLRLYWIARTVDSVGDIHTVQKGSTVIQFDDADSYILAPLAILPLPLARADGATTQIELQRADPDSGGALPTLTLDEAWLFRVEEDSALTALGNARAHVWVDTPTLTEEVPTYWTGNNADRTGAAHPGVWLQAQGDHQLIPKEMVVWTATLGDSYPRVSLEHYERWHSNAAR